ncbi:MAG TPA: hypothetical protein VGP95_12490 [Gemmatimonadaceae bacterium]|jgi:hypothetical protein|nr:hypothetical protein [Gemmatimonadaceae bacterium]
MDTRANRRFNRLALFGAASIALAGCASAGPSSSSTSPSPAASTTGAPTQTRGWRVVTKEHVDLWLHGFALLTSDTGHVPFFARGYKQQVTALKRQRNVFTQLDANQQDLSRRFATNPSLTNAQFLAMYFNSFAEIVEATDFLVRSQGNPRASSNPDVQQRIAFLAANFPTAADRDWVRKFVDALQDESNRFYHDYWTKEQQTRGAAYAQFNQEWTAKYYPKLSRFLNNTQQPSGELLLSLPVGGEGRTINDSKQANAIAVVFPRTPDASAEALYVFTHEIVARLVDEAIRDNTTPAEQRSGASIGYVGNGAVRGGALLLQRVAPELVPGYMRFYLQTLGITAPTGDPSAQFAAAFPIPAPVLTALGRSIESVLGGI